MTRSSQPPIYKRADQAAWQGEYRGRFAPSPTGQLHFGSLVAAMASYLQARQHQGQWFLRIDDIDPPREQAGALQSIISTLKVYGLAWDGDIRYQSHHTLRYERAIQSLHRSKAVYYCKCSRKQILSALAGEASKQMDTLVYPGTCRHKNHPATDAALRFQVRGSMHFHDLLQGTVKQDIARDIGDFVVKRRDGLYAYQLANVVDDMADGITQIVRGNDLLHNTPRQILLTEALGNNACEYLHVPTAIFPGGEKLSKQTLAPALPQHGVLDSLASAWQFLGQQQVPVCSSVESFWHTAIQRWNAEYIPAVPQLLAPASLR